LTQKLEPGFSPTTTFDIKMERVYSGKSIQINQEESIRKEGSKNKRK